MHASGAEVVLRGGPIFTADAARSWTDAVAVRDGKIIAIGSARCREVATSRSVVIDLEGRSALPGFIDAHAHPVFGGLEMRRCDVMAATNAHECIAFVAAYSERNPEAEWIVGGGWSMEHFSGGNPTKELLDTVVPDRPTYLINRDRHGAWVNSAALRGAGIDRTTPDPPQGRIERDSDGNPTGALHESAADLVARLLPPASESDYDAALSTGQDHLHSLGITGWQDALIGEYLNYADTFDTYVRADRDGRLTGKVVGAQWWDRERGLDQIPEMRERRDRTAHGRFKASTVKFMQDGVCENFTAALLRPYLDAFGAESGHCGDSYIDPETLTRAVTAIDHLGFQAHFHTIGDRAVREALDAIESARRTREGPIRDGHGGDNRHHLAHIQVVDAADLPRFRALGVAANMQPLWASSDAQMTKLTVPFLGPLRAGRQYPFEELRELGTMMAAGSDWPVSDAAPLQGVHVAVNRSFPGNPTDEPFTPHQRMALSDVLCAYTAGGAWINHLERRTGTIAMGMSADLAVVDRDLFAVNPAELVDAEIDLTVADGRVVYERPGGR